MNRDCKEFTDYKQWTLGSVGSAVHPSFRKFLKDADETQLDYLEESNCDL